MKNSYEKSVKDRMAKKFPGELVGGAFRGRTYLHVFRNLKDNFIDGEVQIKKCLKGNLTDANIKYHYAEHMNSSQTMCISYFKKFFEKKEYEDLLSRILENQGINVEGDEFTDAVFEYIPYAKEGTNFDFYLRRDTGQQITWEIKFTEREFGGTTKGGANDKYIEKYKCVYIPMLRQCTYYSHSDVECNDYKCLMTGVVTDNCCEQDNCSIHEFYKYYQIRRNILYARNKGDYVLFLTPRENTALDKERTYIEQYAEKWGTDCIRNIYWEELLKTTLEIVASVPDLFAYYLKFKEKYFE